MQIKFRRRLLKSLLETYIEDQTCMPSIIVVEYPELFLHPSLQKTAAEILYKLSKKNQVIFTTHSPNMVANFTRGQICQMVLEKSDYSVARQNADIDDILNDLGYSANDFLNVDFVFIVEGKQDKSRLPLLLNKYYYLNLVYNIQQYIYNHFLYSIHMRYYFLYQLQLFLCLDYHMYNL